MYKCNQLERVRLPTNAHSIAIEVSIVISRPLGSASLPKWQALQFLMCTMMMFAPRVFPAFLIWIPSKGARVAAADELQGLEELHRGYRGVHHLHCEHRWIHTVAAQGHLSENLRNAHSDNGSRARSSPDQRLLRLIASPSCRHHVQRARALHLTSQCTLSDKSVP